MNLKQVVTTAGDGSSDNEESIAELREFFTMVDEDTINRLLQEAIAKDKKYKFDTRGYAFQDLVNEIGRRLGYTVKNGVYRGKRNGNGFDGLWYCPDGTRIIMECKTSDDYSVSISSVTGYRDKLILSGEVGKKKCSILIIYGRDEKGALINTVKGSNESYNIRLISANALFQLMRLPRTDVTQRQIYQLLKPKDYLSWITWWSWCFRRRMKRSPMSLRKMTMRITLPEGTGIRRLLHQERRFLHWGR